ncbi:MAG TPA: DUF1592 domain-containing protein [Polyangia bacterium]|nr:DUF1592 domain-containing protein [Polyangia bacterium]
MRGALAPLSLAAALAVGALACSGRSLGHGGPDGGGGETSGGGGTTSGGPGGNPGSGGAATGGGAGTTATAGTGGAATGGVGGAIAPPPGDFDPGSVGLRRLSDPEYARTVEDLLGLTGLAPVVTTSFSQDPDVGGYAHDYDTLAGHAPVSSTRYEAYFDDAVNFVQQAFASDALRARIVTCAPKSATDDSCAAEIVRAFGLRAWRRPLAVGELDDLVKLARAALDGGDPFETAIQEPLIALLASEAFVYRLELDAPAAGTAMRPLDSYELASRLSYFIWSSMPDDTLFSLAATGALEHPEVLQAQAARMLASPRADGLARNFFGQWLDFRDLTRTLLPRDNLAGWSLGWQSSMAEEARLFVTEVVQNKGKPSDLLTTDVNYVDGNLAATYRLPPNPPNAITRMVLTTDQRKGFLGLAAFLTASSFEATTSPIRRGYTIDEDLLCMNVPNPPPDEPPDTNVGSPRDRMNARLSMTACASCHKPIDPVGIGLETFDETGMSRVAYAADPGVFIQTTGATPDGTPYDGLPDLADKLAKDPRLASCARQEMLLYALGRPATATDKDALARLDARWVTAGGTFQALVSTIVSDDLFRYRRAEGQP